MKPKKNTALLLIAASMSIFASFLCLIGLTYAWFRMNMTLSNVSFIASNFEISTSIRDRGASLIEPVDNQYNLSTGAYTLTIERLGSSTQASGYALINVADTLYCTSTLNQYEAFSFTIEVEGNTSLIIKSMWGEPVGTEDEFILKDAVIKVMGEMDEEEDSQMEKEEENAKMTIE